MFLNEPSIIKVPDAATSQVVLGEACSVNYGSGNCVDGSYTVTSSSSSSSSSSCGWSLVGIVITVSVTVACAP